MKDLIEQLLTVERTVGEGEVPAGPAKVVRLTRTYAAPAEDVWDALTDPERLTRWFLPVSGDLEVGGRYQLEGNAGGVVRVCEAPHLLVVTWEMGPAGPQDSSLVQVRLRDEADGTRLELEHRAQVPPEMWDQFGPGAVGVGWDGALLGLGLHLEGGELGLSPEQLGTDPAIREFNVRSAQEWGRAQVAAGDDPAVVEAQVAATTGFYVPPLEG